MRLRNCIFLVSESAIPRAQPAARRGAGVVGSTVGLRAMPRHRGVGRKAKKRRALPLAVVSELSEGAVEEGKDNGDARVTRVTSQRALCRLREKRRISPVKATAFFNATRAKETTRALRSIMGRAKCGFARCGFACFPRFCCAGALQLPRGARKHQRP